MTSPVSFLALSIILSQFTATAAYNTSSISIHNITRFADFKFENLAIRANGQILTTTTLPNASIYQIDPLDILPPALIYNIPNVGSATGIVEGESDLFYVVSGDVSLNGSSTDPKSYTITELDVHGVSVLPDGRLTRKPMVRHIADLLHASLPNGATFSRPCSSHLLVADSFRGLIWNVDIRNGSVSVSVNDTTTKGITPTGPTSTGVNGVKVHDGVLYWTSTGASSLFKVPIDEQGNARAGQIPSLVAANLTCDDFVLDCEGNVYVAGPLNVITRVDHAGGKRVIAGTFNSTRSALVGPTALSFGRLASDRWSLYTTTNGGLQNAVSGAAGVSRLYPGDISPFCKE